jgi:hypothetical protein
MTMNQKKVEIQRLDRMNVHSFAAVGLSGRTGTTLQVQPDGKTTEYSHDNR